MKKLLTVLIALLVLVGCGGKKEEETVTSEFKDTFNYVYTADLTTFDYLYNNKSTNGDIYNNGVEGLLTQNKYGILSPGMAETWESNADASEWTFHLRKGAKWVTNNGEVYDEVKAQDFVTGLRHATEFDSLTFWLVETVIDGLADYHEGKISWDQVGISCPDDYTVVYKMTGPTPYFPSMTTYSILFPVNQEFLESKGDGCKLGAANAETCNFGALEPDGILYNSAFVLSNHTSKSVIEFTKNDNYWDAENVFLKSIKLTYTGEQTDSNYLYKMFKNGEVDATNVRLSDPDIKSDAEANYKDNLYISDTGTTCYWVALNVNRKAYAAFNDESKVVSTKTEQEREDTKKALMNVNFRRAIMAAFSTHAYEAVSLGEELADGPARNTIVAPTFCRVNGAPYIDVLTQKLQQYKDEGYGDINLADGQDAYYNPTKAKEYLEKAKAELGDTVTWPIKLDTLARENPESSTLIAKAEEQAIEAALGVENVDVIVNITDTDTYYNCWYYVEQGDQTNADLLFFGGWGPDYEDPRTYLNIFLPDNGDMIQNFGFNNVKLSDEAAEKIKEDVGLKVFGAMCEDADAITDNNDERFTKYAAAEAYILSQAIVRPFSTSGATVQLSRVVPYTQCMGNYGWGSYNNVPIFKGMKVYADKIQTTAEHEAAKKAWMAGE